MNIRQKKKSQIMSIILGITIGALSYYPLRVWLPNNPAFQKFLMQNVSSKNEEATKTMFDFRDPCPEPWLFGRRESTDAFITAEEPDASISIRLRELPGDAADEVLEKICAVQFREYNLEKKDFKTRVIGGQKFAVTQPIKFRRADRYEVLCISLMPSGKKMEISMAEDKKFDSALFDKFLNCIQKFHG